MAAEDPLREMIRLVELDYERTASFIDSVVSTGAAIRGLGVTIWAALLGFAVDHGSWALALVGVLDAIVFFVLDGYHGWVYKRALLHAASLERISAAFYNSLGRGKTDPDSLLELRVQLEAHTFGLFQNLGRFRYTDLLRARPRVIFFALYPSLAVAAGLAAFLIAKDWLH